MSIRSIFIFKDDMEENDLYLNWEIIDMGYFPKILYLILDY